MTDARIYGRYLIGGREAFCVEDNRERVDVHYANEFTVLFRRSFDALRPAPVSSGERG